MFVQGNVIGGFERTETGSLPVIYKGEMLPKDFIIDQLVEEKIVLESKSVEILLPIHEAQLVTYLKLSGKN